MHKYEERFNVITMPPAFAYLCVLTLLLSTVPTVSSVDEEVFSVVSGAAHLPCNITPPTDRDGVRLVLWYKDEDPQPIYSFDARFSSVKHWSEDPAFGPRAYFRDSSQPAQLIISNVEMDDKGIYKCRVDFRDTPTVIKLIKLNIVAEPKKPVILDDEGSAVMGSIGPFRLSKPLILVCIVEGGKPEPEVSWWRDGQLFDNEGDPSTYEDVLQNTLVISALDRSFHDSLLECRAINNNVTQPPSSSVTVLMELPIMDLKISNLPDPVIADVQYDVLCQVLGAQPPPEVTWKLDDVVLPSEPVKLSLENNLTTSQLLFTPKIKDQGKVLSCSAANDIFEAANKSVTLNVYYVPVVNVEIVNDIDPSNIREGDDVVMKCNIQAHPWVWRILWYRDGEELVESERVHIDEQRLKLSNVSKSLSGQYICSASNVEGDGFSKPLMITVKYKPVCIAPTIEYKNDSQGIDLRCQVDSKPKSSTFRWLFNSTSTKFEIPSAEAVMSFTNYKPTSGEQHDGQVLCWASNDLGEQQKPCVFHVVPIGAPQAPRNCQISNHSASTIAVTCDPGYSGGLEQHFVMEVFETTANNTQVLVASNWTDLEDMTDSTATIGVWGLLPESNYIIAVKAVNERGESSPVYVGGKTEGFVQSLPSAVEAGSSRLPMLFVIAGCLVALMIFGAICTAALTIRSRRMNKLKAQKMSNDLNRHHQIVNNSSNNGSQIDMNSKAVTTSTYYPGDSAGVGGRDSPDESAMPLLERSVSPNTQTLDRSTSTSRAGTVSPERKVSFRDYETSGGEVLNGTGHVVLSNEDLTDTCNTCSKCGGKKMMPKRRHKYGSGSSRDLSTVGGRSRVLNNGLPVERAVVRTFSIEKLRPICPICNPAGTTPYPSDNPLDDILHQSATLITNKTKRNKVTNVDG